VRLIETGHFMTRLMLIIGCWHFMVNLAMRGRYSMTLQVMVFMKGGCFMVGLSMMLMRGRSFMKGLTMRSIQVTTLVEVWPERLIKGRYFLMGLTMSIRGRYFMVGLATRFIGSRHFLMGLTMIIRGRYFMVGLAMGFIGCRYFMTMCRNFITVLVMVAVVLMRELRCAMHRGPVRSVEAGGQLRYDGRAQGPAHVDRVLLGLAVSVPLVLAMIYVSSVRLIFSVSAMAMAAIAVVIVAIVVLRIAVAAVIMSIVSISTVPVPGAVIESKSEPVSTLCHCKQQHGEEKQFHPHQNSIVCP